MEIVITEGDYKGRRGQIVEEGTFNVFGKQINGVKVEVPGLAGPLVLKTGEYAPAAKKEKPEIFKRFTKGGY
ncbi:hypothetical protein ACF5W4_10995 [Bacillota bacterium Lsc_1132]